MAEKQSEVVLAKQTETDLKNRTEILFMYYFPKGKIRHRNLTVLHDGNREGTDQDFARKALKKEYLFSEEELKMLRIIANKDNPFSKIKRIFGEMFEPLGIFQ